MGRHSTLRLRLVASFDVKATELRLLYVCHAVPREDSAAGAGGVERSETTRAPAGDGSNGAIFLDRADSPGATMWLQRPKYFWRAPLSDLCPGEAAVTDAQWGDRA